MKRLMKKIMPMLLVAALAVSGCATVPLASPDLDTKIKSFAPPPNKAALYIYRNEYLLAPAIRMTVLVNGKIIGQTAPKTYFRLDVNPGKYTIISQADNLSTITITAEAGKSYYIWQEVKLGPLAIILGVYGSGDSQPHLVSEDVGRAGVAECDLIVPIAELGEPESVPANPPKRAQIVEKGAIN